MTMVSRASIIIPLLVLAVLIAYSVPTTLAVSPEGKPVVAIDLAHGENDKAVADIVGNLSGIFEFKILTEAFTPEALADVDILIIGQPMTALSPDELVALEQWFSQGGKVLWVAGDSDYGTGPQAQAAANAILEFIGATLRIDPSAVYDDVVNAGRFYRVVGLVQPDEDTPYREVLTFGLVNDGKVLYHGPAPLAWVDENGDWHSLTKSKPDNVYRIVWTSENGYIGDNNDPPTIAYVDELLNEVNDRYVMLAAEVRSDTRNVIIVSGESPYGDYQPTWTTEYYGVALDGPRFVTNLLLWAYTNVLTSPVTVTETVVQTQTVTQTTTETLTQTVTETATETTTQTVTNTVTNTVTETTTETVTKTSYGAAAGIGILLLIIGIAIGFYMKK